MVEVNTKIQTPTQRLRARVENLKKLHTRPGIRVEPANDDMRKYLKHPRAGAFRSEGSIEWPDDIFTHRRLKDGSVKRVESHAESASDEGEDKKQSEDEDEGESKERQSRSHARQAPHHQRRGEDV